MPDCNIPYIPDHLHANERIALSTFSVGEELYFRCDPKDLDNPYKGISITELSHNRSRTGEEAICEPEDVLWNIREEDDFQRYPNKVVCTLTIRDLNEDFGYKKEYSQKKDNEDRVCVMALLHEPETCMFPHCVFRVWVDGVTISYENYKATIQKLNEIRNRLKAELASMIFRREVSQSNSPSDLEESNQ